MIETLKGMLFELIALAVAVLAFVLLGRAYLHQRDAFTQYRAQAEQRQADATAALERQKAQELVNLSQLRKNYEAQISSAGPAAVANFCLRNPALCRAPAPAPSGGDKVDDDPGGERLPSGPDPETRAFIERAGRDALKVRAWIEYCTRNNCPVVD